MNKEILDMVKSHLGRPPWRVAEIYLEAKRMDPQIVRLTVPQFRRKYIAPVLLNGQESTAPKRTREEVFTSKIRKRMDSMTPEKNKSSGHDCPAKACNKSISTRAALARHIDTVHRTQAAKLREAVGLDPGAAWDPDSDEKKKVGEPLLLSNKDRLEIKALLQKELKRLRPDPEQGTTPPREEVRAAFLGFAKEVRDTTDPLEIVESLSTWVELVYGLFAGEVEQVDQEEIEAGNYKY